MAMAELTPQERGVLEQIELLLKSVDLQEAVRRLTVMIGDADLVERVVAIRQAIAESTRRIALNAANVDLEDAPISWYTGPGRDDLFWPALERTLLADPGWRDAVPALAAASTDVVGLLADPHSPTIRTRGLVLGHVQSGKTASFTATIAKAADAGYRLFIVLSGMHNALRRQTQLRLDQQLYELHKTKWLPLTDEQSDFGNPVKALPLVASADLRLLAVVKKNPARLTRLRDWLMAADAEGGLDTCPVLIIDDESDQASPNASANALADRTTVNQRIVELLGLPRVAYIGYTATPFANVLINPTDIADIYPRHFIYSLTKPASYFGPEELFGIRTTEEEESPETAPHDMFREVSPDEAELHAIQKGEPFSPQVTPALGEAIRWFVLATAARRFREGRPSHSSMLIHTTMRVDPQLDYLPEVRRFLGELRSQWKSGDIVPWRDQWRTEQEREPSERHGLEPVAFEDLGTVVPTVLAEVRVVADNSRSTERLLYSDDPATVIAVGGNTLSRGLTLEGLVSSYFLRSSGTYDSLLQMGRWFGYRPGYGDLPRIWTTDGLAGDFRFLSEVEADLRAEIERNRVEGATPRELPVRIRLHPRMQVTAKRKMQFAVPGAASYSGQRPQTTYFHHRTADVESNRSAAADLLKAAQDAGSAIDPQDSRIVLQGVSADDIQGFIDRYRFHPDTDLRSDLLTSYLEGQRANGALEEWNIAVITRKSPAVTLDLGLNQPVNLISRSKLSSSNEMTANIGTLMSRPDRVADLMSASEAGDHTDPQLLDARTRSGRALLLLYPIDKDSQPKPSAEGYRLPLDASGHLVAAAFSFPRAVPGSEPIETVQVDPVLLGTPDDADDSAEEYVDDEGDRDDIDLSDV